MPTPIDFPVHGYVDVAHSIFIDEIMHPARFQRMLDNSLRMPGGAEAYEVSELLHTLSAAVWSELENNAPINSFRRNLQRRYTDQLVRLMLDSPSWSTSSSPGPGQVRTPEDVRSLSRLELTELREAIGSRLATAGLERDTKAHLLETAARIDKAFDASVTSELK